MSALLGDIDYGPVAGPPPVLLAGDNAGAMARAAAVIEASGLRIAGECSVAGAAARLGQQASATAVWIELGEDGGAEMDRLLAQVGRECANGRYASVVSTVAALIDQVSSEVGDAPVDIIVDADDAERAAALSLALARRNAPARLADAASDRSAVRLRQLSDEVSRIASTLARLSTGPSATRRPAPQPVGDLPDVAIEDVRSVIRARRLRNRYFPEHLFADPAWDMLLDLLQAELAQLRVPVSSLCIAAAVPATTALRWLKSMTDEGIFVRRADPHDGRRVFVELSPQASAAMRRYFTEVGQAVAV